MKTQLTAPAALPSALIAGGAVLAAALIGARRGPQHPRTALWYASLRKPSYTPPGPVFGAAWAVLDTLTGVSGYRLLRAKPGTARSVALSCWALSVAGIAGYPWVFFGRKQLGESAAVVGAMLASASTYVAAAERVDRPAAALGVPLVLWIGFAGLLSEEIWRRN